MPEIAQSGSELLDKWLFDQRGKPYFVPQEHSTTAIELARSLGMLKELQSIQQAGCRTPWILLEKKFLSKGWVRVRRYRGNEIGLYAKLRALTRLTTYDAMRKVMPKAKVFHLMTWPAETYAMVKRAGIRRADWGAMVRKAMRDTK